MTKWNISITASSKEEDSLILKLMNYAGKLGLRYQVSSKEVSPEVPAKQGREGGLVK